MPISELDGEELSTEERQGNGPYYFCDNVDFGRIMIENGLHRKKFFGAVRFYRKVVFRTVVPGKTGGST